MVQYDMMLTARNEDAFDRIIDILNKWDGKGINIQEQRTISILVDRIDFNIAALGGYKQHGQDEHEDFLNFYAKITPYIRSARVDFHSDNGDEWSYGYKCDNTWHRYNWDIDGKYRGFNSFTVNVEKEEQIFEKDI